MKLKEHIAYQRVKKPHLLKGLWGRKGDSHEFLNPLRRMTGAFFLPRDYPC